MSGSQEDASAVADGRLSDGSRSSQVSPRMPDGPSETRMRRSPIFSIGQVVQKSRPVSSWTFSSTVSAASAPAIFESLVRAVMKRFLLVLSTAGCHLYEGAQPHVGRGCPDKNLIAAGVDGPPGRVAPG